MRELPKPNPSVLFQPVEEGAVLLDPVQEIYFGTNDVGAQVWQLLSTCTTLDQLCTTLGSNYPEVDAAVLRTDVVELLDTFQAEGLVIAAAVDAR